MDLSSDRTLKRTIQSDATYYVSSVAGSIAFICQPIGSLMSGFIVEFFGRKWSMILVNIPFLLGWLLYCFSSSITMLFTANIILGMGIGFMEAPIMTYLGETCQPHLRATITSFPGVTCQVSVFVVFLMGNITDWRSVAGINAALPIFTICYVVLMPETPIWLLSRGRYDDALRSLCWLRGWTTPDDVREEFNQLVVYSNAVNKTNFPVDKVGSTVVNNQVTRLFINCTYRLWREMLRPSTLRPLMLVVPYFLIQQFSGMASIRPYMVHVFRKFGLDDAAVGSAVIGIIGAVCLVSTVNWLGKRFLSLVALAGNGVSCLLLGVYSYVVLRPGGATQYEAAWLPLSLIVVLSFCSSVMFEVPWMMLSEVFPFRTRGIASGFSAAMCYVFLFVSSKTYLDMEQSLHIHGAFLLFAAVNAVGFIFVYYRMPRMEGRSLAEIEDYF
ncbi:Solute carrier family 2, facilitated glucose transporter member 6, partial [Zootermopsis nevadensis]